MISGSGTLSVISETSDSSGSLDNHGLLDLTLEEEDSCKEDSGGIQLLASISYIDKTVNYEYNLQ